MNDAISTRKRIGRPPLAMETEILNVKVAREVMADVRQITNRSGMTIAAFVRQALEEKVDREKTR